MLAAVLYLLLAITRPIYAPPQVGVKLAYPNWGHGYEYHGPIVYMRGDTDYQARGELRADGYFYLEWYHRGELFNTEKFKGVRH